MSRIERVVDVVVEVERSVECRRARRVARGVFEIEPRLQIVRSPDLREIVRPVPDVVGPEEGEALLDVELRRVLDDSAESGVRDQVQRVDRREELRQRQAELDTVDRKGGV